MGVICPIRQKGQIERMIEQVPKIVIMPVHSQGVYKLFNIEIFDMKFTLTVHPLVPRDLPKVIEEVVSQKVKVNKDCQVIIVFFLIKI